MRPVPCPYLLMFRKNKNSEKTGARARNTPIGTRREALTNEEHSRTRSVRIYVQTYQSWRKTVFDSTTQPNNPVMHDGFSVGKRIVRSRIGLAMGDVVALAAGFLMPFAFAPFGFYGLTIVALALLFQVLLVASAGRGFWRGWIFGLAMFGTGVFWIHESFRFAAVSLPLALLLTGGLIGILAIYPALFGFFAALWSRRFAMPSGSAPTPASGRLLSISLGALLVFPAGWTLLEWMRGWFLTGFPWLQVGYAHGDSPLAGLAPLLGVYGVGWAVALSAGLLLVAFRLVMENRNLATKARIIGLSSLLALGGGIWGGSSWLDQGAWSTPTGAPIGVALIQGNIPQDEKWLPALRQPTLERYLSLTRREAGRDLVVWPETALPGSYHHFTDFIAILRREARFHHMNILFGVPTLEGKSQRHFNSIAAITDMGEVLFYHKKHLVPFGEYLPMAGILRGILDFLKIPMSDFSAGPAGQLPFSVAGQSIGASVCYEASFGENIIASLSRATLLVNVSNEAWFGDSRGPHQNLQMARMRALESERYLLRATNTGISAIIDPQGRIVGRAPQFQLSVLTGTVTGMRGVTPYARYGNWIIVSGALLVLMIGIVIGAFALLKSKR